VAKEFLIQFLGEFPSLALGEESTHLNPACTSLQPDQSMAQHW